MSKAWASLAPLTNTSSSVASATPHPAPRAPAACCAPAAGCRRTVLSAARTDRDGSFSVILFVLQMPLATLNLPYLSMRAAESTVRRHPAADDHDVAGARGGGRAA